ncbi:MAG TPA: radical SAM protein [Bryobacteraceae bacterium]|nr:radical SAM protein [Bryobacteraceae bacterium]
MRFWNRAKLLAGYLGRRTRVNALPVEYIVETTAKCNLYCPMCPRETHKQPKEDMDDGVFERLVRSAGESAEHMMLIGLGEPLLDPKIFERIEFCGQHKVFTLLSTNGTLLDAKATERLLDTDLEHITFSFDGSTRESFEYYRKGAKFERVRDNFIHFAKRKKERNSRLQIVVQMVRMERNWDEVEEFSRFWGAIPGVDEVRIKADETDLMNPDAAHAPQDWQHPCHYLWRGAMYVKHNGDVYPCCQSYNLGGAPVGNIGKAGMPEIFNSPSMLAMRTAHVEGRAGDIPACAKCRTAIPHPLLVAGSLVFHGRTVRKLLPWVERLAYFGRWSGLLRPVDDQRKAKPELVQIKQK